MAIVVAIAADHVGARLAWAATALLQGNLQADQFEATARLLSVEMPLLIAAELSPVPAQSGNPSVVGVLTADGNIAFRTLHDNPLEDPVGQFVDFKI